MPVQEPPPQPPQTDRRVSDPAQRLEGLLDVARLINSSLDLEQVLERILSQACRLMGAEGGSIMLLDETRLAPDDPGALKVVAASGPRAGRIRGRSQAPDAGISGWVARNGQPLLLHGSARTRLFGRVPRRADVRDALCAPLKADGQVIGVISLNNHAGDRAFSQEDLELLVALSHQAAIAIRNARAFEEMNHQRRTVDRLLEELTRAQEEERKRISLLIHDGPAQTMFAALRHLEVERARRRQGDAGGAAEPRDGLAGIESAIRTAIQETRGLMVDLRPITMQDIGLFAALLNYGKQFERRTGIDVHVQRSGGIVRLPPQVETNLYRIVQEALTNTWKHSGAHSASVSLTVTEDTFTVTIQDDGRGFEEPAAEPDGEHLGLRTMRERVAMIGGRLVIESTPARGASVQVTLPIARQEGAEAGGRW